MPKLCYRDKSFRKKTLEIIQTANKIIETWADQGFDLTLRQLYYQFVARDLFPNTERSYNMLGTTINDARLAGLVDWDNIVDRTRNVRQNSHWNSPQEIIKVCANQYQINKWENQKYKVEVWIEKDALIGVIEDVCKELDVGYFSCRGYVSQSEMWSAGYERFDKPTIIFHLGDHDPSGIDMTRDIQTRLSMFSDDDVEVKRIALNQDQIKKYNPPPNPAKVTDSRFDSYRDLYGEESWELDALEPQVLVDLVRKNVLEIRDDDLWEDACLKESKDIQKLEKVMQGMEE